MKFFSLFSITFITAAFLFLVFTTYAAMSQQTDAECPSVPKRIRDRRFDTKSLRLVQYNAEWLFWDYYSAMDCPGNGCTWKNTSEAEKHMESLSNILKTINGDIIVLCEVEGCDEMHMLNDMLNGYEYSPYLKKGTDTGTGQNVGLLTRIDPMIDLYRTEEKVAYPVPGSKCGYTSTGTSGVSKHFITEMMLGNMHIALIAAHLIAIPRDASRCAQREAQATVLQKVVNNYINTMDYEVIVIGDFNDYDDLILDMNNNMPTSMVLDILKGYAGELAGKYELYSVADRIDQKDRYSDWWDSDNNCNTSSSNDYSMIDHVLLTPNLLKYVANVSIYHGYDEFCGKYNSDHYPVLVDFVFP
jgi:exonuclease III